MKVCCLQSLGSLARASSQQDGDELQGIKDGRSKTAPKFERLRLTSGGQEGGLHVSTSRILIASVKKEATDESCKAVSN